MIMLQFDGIRSCFVRKLLSCISMCKDPGYIQVKVQIRVLFWLCKTQFLRKTNLIEKQSQGLSRQDKTFTHQNPESRLDPGQGPQKDASIQARSDSHHVKDNLTQTERETQCKDRGLNPDSHCVKFSAGDQSPPLPSSLSTSFTFTFTEAATMRMHISLFM